MKKIIGIAALILTQMSIYAQGTDCATANFVSSNNCSAVGAYDNTGISGTLSAPSCFSGGTNNGMWFQFLASTPVVNIAVVGSTLTQPQVSLLSPPVGGCSGGTFTELACTSSATATATLTYSALTVGNTYYIYVDGVNNLVGTFQLCVASPAQPSNDIMCNAISLPTNNFCSPVGAYTNLGATPDMTTASTIYPASCWNDGLGANNGVWFKFVPTGNAVDITINGLTAPIITVVQPPANLCSSTDYINFLERSCAESTSGTTATASSTFYSAGQTYYILVDGYNNSAGPFQICVNSYIPAALSANDACSGSFALCPGISYTGSTLGGNPNAATDPPVSWGNGNVSPATGGSCNGDNNYTMYYDFWTNAANSPVVLQITPDCVSPTANLLQVGIFGVTGGAPCSASNWTYLVCDASSQSFTSPFTLSTTSAMTSANTHYYLVFDSFPTTPCDYTFSISGNRGTDAGADQSVCVTSAPLVLSGATPAGGTWSGPGITNAATGAFDPATAGVGVFTLYYTQGACTDSKTMTVNGVAVTVSNDITICQGQSTTLLGSLTATPAMVPQSFSNTTDFAIPDANATGITSPIAVSGITPATVGTNPIVTVCLNITHTRDDNLEILLQCPGGAQIQLSTDNGGAGDNYTNTCFSSAGAAIIPGTAPFTGTFTPEQAFSMLNGCNINGTWSLIVRDDQNSNTGTLLDWTITFNTAATPTYSWSPTTAMVGSTTLNPTVTPLSTLTYTLTGTNTAGCTSFDQVTVTVITPIVISNIVRTCVGSDYVVEFDITGGNPASYSVTGGTGTLTAGHFTSSAIVSGVSYSFTVNDIYNCTPQIVSGTFVCGCNVNAVLSGGGVACAGQAVPNVVFNLTGGTSSPYTLTYSINGASQPPVVVSAGFPTSVYSITSPVSGTYAIVSITDALCTGSSIGSAAVVYNVVPTAIVSGGGTICSGNTSPVSFAFTGPGPWTLTYAIAGVDQPAVAVSTSPYVINTAAPGAYTITSVTNANCTGTSSGAATVTVNSLPTATISGGGQICADGSLSTITFNFVGTSPWNMVYAIGGVDQPVVSTSSNPYSFTTSNPGSYTITSISDAICSGSFSGNATVVLNPLPVFTLTYTDPSICGAADGTITIAGLNITDDYALIYLLNGSNVGPTNYTTDASGNIILSGLSAGTYSGFSVTLLSTGCVGTIPNSIALIEPGAPVLVITNPPAVCSPLTVDITAASVTAGSVNSDTLTYWSDAAATVSLVNPSTLAVGTTYYVQATNLGCFDIAPVIVTINPIPPAPTVGTDTTYCSSWLYSNMTSSGNGGTYTWYLDAATTPPGIATGSSLIPNDVTGVTTYYVTETLLGCEGPASIVIITINDCLIIVPTAFTPDADIVNDNWEIVDLDKVYPNNQVTVFNRWGAKLYESKKGAYSSKPWDGTFEGKTLPVGSYYFIIDFNLEDVEPMKGIVSIILD